MPARKPRRKRKAKIVPQATRQRSRGDRLSPKLDAALDLIAEASVRKTRLTLKEAAERVGLRRESLSSALRRGHVTARALEKVRALLGGATLVRAAATLGELLNHDSGYVQLEAAKHVLSVAGVKPAERNAVPMGGVTVNLILKHVLQPAVPLVLDGGPALMAPDAPPER